MATITVDIDALEDLADAADTRSGAADKLTDYWDKLHDKVEYEINRYSGEKTGNITTAYSFVSSYRDDLSSLQGKFVTFAQRARNLKDKAENLESGIIRTINNDLRAFCNKYGLEYKESDEKPGFWAGLWNSICNVYYDLKERIDNFFERISEWYNYDGGKEILEAVFTVLLVIATIAVMILAFPVLATGSLIAVIASALVIVASAILLVFEVMDSIIKIGHAINAVSAACEDRYFDAAWETKMREESSTTDWLRDHGMYDLANTLDTVKFVCDIIKFADGFVKGFTKFKTFIKDFKFTGFFKDFGKNMNDFFSNNAIGHMLFGAEYDGSFFGGDLVDVFKRIKTTLTIVDVAYKEITYHDATGKKSVAERAWDRLTTAKPVFDIVTSNIWEAGTVQRHDMKLDPNSTITSRTESYYNRNGEKVEITVSEQKIVDQTTGKVTGTQTVTTMKNTKTGTKTVVTESHYEFQKADGTGQKKTISKTEYISKDNTVTSNEKTVTQTKDKGNDFYNKRDYQTTTTTETYKTETKWGSTEHTTTRENKTQTDGSIFENQRTRKSTNTYTVSDSNTINKGENVKVTTTRERQQTATSTEGKGATSSNSSSTSQIYKKETSKPNSSNVNTKTASSAEGKGTASSNSSNVKTQTDTYTHTKGKTADSYTYSKENTRKPDSTVISEKNLPQGKSNLIGDTIDSYNKVAGKLNKMYNFNLPTSDSDNLVGKAIDFAVDRGSVIDTGENIYNTGKGIYNYFNHPQNASGGGAW